MKRVLCAAVALLLLPGVLHAQSQYRPKNKYQAHKQPAAFVRMESSDHAFTLAAPLGWLLLTGDTKQAVEAYEAVKKEPGTEALVKKLESGLYVIFALNIFDAMSDHPVGANMSALFIPAPPFEFTEEGIDDFKGGFMQNPAVQDLFVKMIDINGAPAYQCVYHLTADGSEFDGLSYAFRHGEKLLMLNVAVAKGTLDVARYDKVARSIKFKD